MKQKFKRGDEVVVISGAHKGKRGKVLQVLNQKDRIIIEGVALIKRHTKPGTRGQEDQGGIQEREGSIHRSNVMLAERFDQRKAS